MKESLHVRAPCCVMYDNSRSVWVALGVLILGLLLVTVCKCLPACLPVSQSAF